MLIKVKLNKTGFFCVVYDNPLRPSKMILFLMMISFLFRDEKSEREACKLSFMSGEGRGMR